MESYSAKVWVHRL